MSDEFSQFAKHYADDVQAHRDYGYKLYKQGQFQLALSYFLTTLQRQKDKQLPPHINDYTRTISTFYALKDFQAAINLSCEAMQHYPQEAKLRRNHATILTAGCQYQQAYEILLELHAEDEDNLQILDGLASVCGQINKVAEAKLFGTRSLELKHKEALALDNLNYLRNMLTTPFKLPRQIPAFNPSLPNRNVIAFSLWGQDPLYTRTALMNAHSVHGIYPGWTCRFYCDHSVPPQIIDQLIQAGAQVIMMQASDFAYNGLFWRFLVANDASVDRFLIRDCDSLLNCRERLAVDEWLASDKCFHVMRDWTSHTELILAGLWGGVANVLPRLQPLINQFYQRTVIERTIDQRFLRLYLWPLIQKSVLCHDRFFAFNQPQRFPPQGQYPLPSQHVGERYLTVPATTVTDHYRSHYSDNNPTRTCVFTISTGRSGTGFLAELLRHNLTHASVYHEKTNPTTLGMSAPEASHLTRFNIYGNTEAIQSFWRQKLLGDLHCNPSSCYVETSHILAKAGLIENLSILDKLKQTVHIIDLRRDLFATAWSLLNRFDFANTGLMWMFYLTPTYPKIIIDPKPYHSQGMLGHILWYIHEMRARGAYYEKLLAPLAFCHYHRVALEDLTQTANVNTLLANLQLPAKTTDLIIPAKINSQQQHFFADNIKQRLLELTLTLDCQADQRGQDFFAQGKRLG